MKKVIVLIVLGTVLVVGSASGQVYVRTGPPVAIIERPPVRPAGRYVWVGGFYRWDGRRYVWVPGRWVIPPRQGYTVWVPGRWDHRSGGWIWVDGRWR